MTIHYPAGNRSETSRSVFKRSYHVKLESHLQSAAARSKGRKYAVLHAVFVSLQQQRFEGTLPNAKAPKDAQHQQNHYFEKSPKQDRFYFFKSTPWLT